MSLVGTGATSPPIVSNGSNGPTSDPTVTPPTPPIPTPPIITPPTPPIITPTTPPNTTPTTGPTTNPPIYTGAYPIRFTYVERITDMTQSQLPISLGVPGYAPNHDYNYMSLSTWTSLSGVRNAAVLWDSPTTYFLTNSSFGSTDSAIRTSLKSLYASAGIKLLLTVFGVT
jgi:hypothetical protein